MHPKLKPHHRSRKALVYIRQSTTTQIFNNHESTRRQYQLAQRAQAMGWTETAVEIIDEDLGRSGAQAKNRPGFTRLVQSVARSQVGAIFVLELSRLARSSSDWQRLIALCAVTRVLLIDDNTIYDPNHHNDKLLLDIQGTMSEAELHWLSLRLAGARRSKAQRGELRMRIPTGYVWANDQLVLDPDEAVVSSIRLLFERFSTAPSAWSVVRWANESHFQMPTRVGTGIGVVKWVSLSTSRLCYLLHNPVYAGVYAYGRYERHDKIIDGEIRRVLQPMLPPEKWAVCRHDAHPAYISWAQWQANQDKLRHNQTWRVPAVPGAPREGAALLIGLLLCGRCGQRMGVNYWRGKGWSYLCRGERRLGGSVCWSVSGRRIDEAITTLFLDSVTPKTIAVAREVEAESHRQVEQLSRWWQIRLEKAAYTARLAERRYLAVDPDNRIVARTLEKQWEERLLELEELKSAYENARLEKRVELSAVDEERLSRLAGDLRRVWQASTTSAADRKAMLRLAIAAITLSPEDGPPSQTAIKVQWRSGVISALEVDRPGQRRGRATPPAIQEQIRRLAASGLRDETIADQLNEQGLVTGARKPWTMWAVRWVRQRHQISRTYRDRPRSHSLPDQHPDGRYSIAGAARRFSVTPGVVRRWIKRGLVKAEQEDFQAHRRIWWLHIDEETATTLRTLPRRGRSKTLPSNNNP